MDGMKGVEEAIAWQGEVKKAILPPELIPKVRRQS